MSSTEIASAYDAIAADYDRQLEGDGWMRELLWQHYLRRFGPGDRVLDVSCGTGLDSLFLAQRGVLVTGIDISSGMIAQLLAKAARLELQDRLEARVMDFADLGSWPAGGYDGIVSAFAGLSTTPDLTLFSRHAARLLRPEGRMVLHLLNRFSLWEWLGLMRDRRWSEASQLGALRSRRFVVGGRALHHHLFCPREAYERFFSRQFLLKESYSFGTLRPPHTVRRVPGRVARALGALERPLAHRSPFLNWGRFFVLDLELRREVDR